MPTPRLVSLLCLLLIGCDGGAPPAGRPPGADLQPEPDGGGAGAGGGPADGALGGAGGGGPDLGGDAGPEPGGDGGPDAGGDGGPDAGCLQAASARPGEALRFEGCRLVKGGLEAPPRGVVLATDSLRREARTPLHEPEQLAELAAAGVDHLWLLLFWEGLEPFEGTFNGAYMGRVCQQIGWAHAAGLGVVLAVYQEGFGAGTGGIGAPAWAGAGAAEAAWERFWATDGAALTPAWARLLATCDGVAGVVGLAPLLGRFPAPREAFARYAQALEASAEAVFGPLLVFWPPELAPAALPADHGVAFSLAPAPQGRAQPPEGLAGGVALVGDPDPSRHGLALAAATGAGWPTAVWADGFGGAYALRDSVGAPAAGFVAALGDPWPTAIAGRLLGFGPEADGAWRARWIADGRGQGISRLRLPSGGEPAVSLRPDGPFDWVSGFDPVRRELTVFVEGAVGEVELTLRWGG